MLIQHKDYVEAITVIGNGHYRELHSEVPEWDVEEWEAFNYKGDTYYLGEFFHPPDFLKDLGFHGIRSDSYFSGLLIKLDEYGDAVQVYRYYS